MNPDVLNVNLNKIRHMLTKGMSNYFVIILILISFNCSLSQEYKYSIDEFTTAHGISDDYIIDIAIDSKNNVWYAHRKGIVKYDGIEFIEIPELIFDQRIKQIIFDKEDVLWILFSSNSKLHENMNILLKFYDPKTKKFVDYLSDNEVFIPEILSEKPDAIDIDYKKEIIISFKGYNIYHVDDKKYIENESFQHLSTPLQVSDTYSRIPYRGYHISLPKRKHKHDKNSYSYSIFYENSNKKYSIKLNKLTKLFSLRDEKDDEIVKNLKSYLKFREGKESVYFYNLVNFIKIDKSTNKKNDLKEIFKSELNAKEIFDVEIENNNIWVATSNGLYRIRETKNKFTSYLQGLRLSIRDFQQIGQDSVLVASESGLYLYKINDKTVTKLISNLDIYGITKVNANSYHLGTFGKKFYLWNIENPNEYYSEFLDKRYKRHLPIINGLKTQDGNVWICTNTNISLIDPINNKIIESGIEPISMNIMSLFETRDGEILCLGNDGIYKLDKSTNQLNQFTTIKNINVSFVREDEHVKNILWICTTGDGLIRYDLQTDKHDTINIQDGLLNNNVHSIYEDQNEKLWLSTDYGISVIDKTTNEIINLTKKNGLHENEMNRHSFLQLADGTLMYGTINGFFHFDPNEINLSSNDQDPHFKYLEYIDSKDNSLKKVSTEANQSISLKTNYKNPTLIFAPSEDNYSNQLRYLVVDQNSKWQYTTNNKINLSFLEGGMTNLLISKKIDFDKWSDPIYIKVEKELSFFKSWLFYLLLGIFLLLIFMYLANLARIRAASMNRKIQDQVKIQTKELSIKNTKLSDAQILNEQIFSIIGHDLRSPILSLLNISNSLTYLLEKQDHKSAMKLSDTVELNATNLLNTVDRLLQWSKSYKSKTQLHEFVSINEFLNSILVEYSRQIKEKELEVKIEAIDTAHKKMYVETVGVILGNLVQNAIKYSYPKEEIIMKYSFDETKQKHKISVFDFGIGIRPSLIDDIKNSTEIRSTKGTKGEAGLGLGLKLCLLLLDTIDGELSVSNNDQEGSTFTIYC